MDGARVSHEHFGASVMVALSIALTWIAITAISVVGLSALAHAAATSSEEADFGLLAFEDEPHAYLDACRKVMA